MSTDRFARQTADRPFSREDRSPTADLPTAIDFDADTVELDPPTSEQVSNDPPPAREACPQAEPVVARDLAAPTSEEPTQVSVTVQVHRGAAAPAPSVHVSAPTPAQVTPSVAKAAVAPPARAKPVTAGAAPAPARPSTATPSAASAPSGKSRPRTETAPAVAPKFVVPAFREGETIRSRYVLEEQVGAGGSSLVFRARDLRRDAMFDRDAYVALKVPREHLRKRGDIADRLKREFHQTQALAHPNIVRVFDIDCDHDTWFITMELLDGESLSTLLACLHPQVLPRSEALGILRGCGESLAFAHDRGVLHCDFKPGNVFVTQREDVRVLDFGVAGANVASKGAEQGERSGRVTAATPCYASPEILEGLPPDERDDVFSLACVAYEVLTGEHPFERRSTLEARESGMSVPRLPGLDRRHYRALQRALSWSRKRRQGSIREFLFTMGLAQQQPSSMGWLKAGAAVAAGALLAALGYNFYSASRQVEPASPGIHWAAASPAEVRARRPEKSGAGQGEGASGNSASAPGSKLAPGSDARNAGAGPKVAANPPATNARPPDARAAGAAVGAAGVGSSIFAPGITGRGSTAIVQSHPVDAAPLAAVAPAAPENRISLEQARIVASEGAVSAVIRVRRLDDLSGRIRIQWRAIPGTAQPGSDYSMDGLGKIDIPEGQDVRVLFIPILNDKSREPSESFDVELFGVEGPGSLQPISRTTVTILDND